MKNLSYKILFVCVVELVVCSSCSNMSESDILKKINSGIVLVQNKSFFELNLPNGNSIYFASYDEKDGFKGMATEKDSIQYATSYGSGFFVSKDGKIATNNHVISANIDKKKVVNQFQNFLEALKEYYEKEYYEYEVYRENIAAEINNKYYNGESFNFENVLYNAVIQEMEEFSKVYNEINKIDMRDAEIIYHNEVSIAYNNEHVTSEADFISCVVLNTDKEHDVALLQLKNKKTPEDKYIFKVEDKDPLENVAWNERKSKNDKLFMIGFNYGPNLAITSEGLKAQITQGSVSQQTSDRIMYTIPALSGSSGSPVVNQKAQLVAINYAGIKETQNFNYGIRVKYLEKLLEK